MSFPTKQELIDQAMKDNKDDTLAMLNTLGRINKRYSAYKYKYKKMDEYWNATEEGRDLIRSKGLEALLKRQDAFLVKEYKPSNYFRVVIELRDGTRKRYFFYQGRWQRA